MDESKLKPKSENRPREEQGLKIVDKWKKGEKAACPIGAKGEDQSIISSRISSGI
jgi:hypothetical protein